MAVSLAGNNILPYRHFCATVQAQVIIKYTWLSADFSESFGISRATTVTGVEPFYIIMTTFLLCELLERGNYDTITLTLPQPSLL